MSLFNEILSPRYNAVLHKLLNMKDGAPAPQLASDIQPGITLEQDRPEWKFLANEWMGSQRLTRAADAANFAAVGIFNGNLTGTLVMIDKIIISTVVAGAYLIRMGCTTALVNTVRGNASDNRWLLKQSSGVIGNCVEAALTGVQLASVNVPAASSLVLDFPCILPPNTGQTPIPNIVVETPIVNQAVDATFIFRERSFEPSETR